MIIGFQIFGKNYFRVLSGVFRVSVFDTEIIIKEITDEFENLFPVYKIFSWLLADSSQIENFFDIILMPFKQRKDFRLKFSGPGFHKLAEPRSGKLYQNVF